MAPRAQSDSTPRGSRPDGPPPLPPSLSDKKADLATLQGPQVGAQPAGQLAEVVLEHDMLAEQLLISLGRMLPSFVPVAAQIQASLRMGVVQALKQATTSPGQSLAQGAGPSVPPQPPTPPGQAAGGGGMPPPPGPASPSPAGTGAPAM